MNWVVTKGAIMFGYEVSSEFSRHCQPKPTNSKHDFYAMISKLFGIFFLKIIRSCERYIVNQGEIC